MIDIGPSEGTLSPQDAGASLPLCLPWSSWGAQEDTLGWLRPNLPTYLGFVLSCFVFFRKYLITLIGPLLSQALIPPHTHTMNEMGDTLQWSPDSRGPGGGGEDRRGHVPSSTHGLSSLRPSARPQGKGTVLSPDFESRPSCCVTKCFLSASRQAASLMGILLLLLVPDCRGH